MYLSVSEVVRPFCEVVSSEDTTGPVTGLAISALDKLLRAGLISEWSERVRHGDRSAPQSSPLVPSLPSAATGIREVAEAITHARFVGTSTASDEVVLMRILKVDAWVVIVCTPYDNPPLLVRYWALCCRYLLAGY